MFQNWEQQLNNKKIKIERENHENIFYYIKILLDFRIYNLCWPIFRSNTEIQYDLMKYSTL